MKHIEVGSASFVEEQA